MVNELRWVAYWSTSLVVLLDNSFHPQRGKGGAYSCRGKMTLLGIPFGTVSWGLKRCVREDITLDLGLPAVITADAKPPSKRIVRVIKCILLVQH